MKKFIKISNLDNIAFISELKVVRSRFASTLQAKKNGTGKIWINPIWSGIVSKMVRQNLNCSDNMSNIIRSDEILFVQKTFKNIQKTI